LLYIIRTHFQSIAVGSSTRAPPSNVIFFAPEPELKTDDRIEERWILSQWEKCLPSLPEAHRRHLRNAIDYRIFQKQIENIDKEHELKMQLAIQGIHEKLESMFQAINVCTLDRKDRMSRILNCKINNIRNRHNLDLLRLQKRLVKLRNEESIWAKRN